MNERQAREIERYARKVTSPFRPIKQATKTLILGTGILYGAYVGVQTYRFVRSPEAQTRIETGKAAYELGETVLRDEKFLELVARYGAERYENDPGFRERLEELVADIEECKRTDKEFSYKFRRSYNPLAER